MTDAKRVLREPARFDGTHMAKLHREACFLDAIPPRAGDAPVTSDTCPHCMLTQQAPLALQRLYHARATDLMSESHPEVRVTQRSAEMSTAAASCFMLSEAVRLPAGLPDTAHVREFTRIHTQYQPEWERTARQGCGGGALHATLAPRDARTLVAAGWAEWHPLASASHPLVLVYAPRSEAEMKLCLRVLDVSRRFMLSSNF